MFGFNTLLESVMQGLGVRTVDNNRLARDVVYHTRVAADMIEGADAFDARKVHEFVRTRIKYEADHDPMDQRLRLPWRTVLEGRTDCKSSAILIGSLAKRAGHEVKLRFVDQTGEGQWDHVYTIVDEVPVDPLCNFGEEVPYLYQHTVTL